MIDQDATKGGGTKPPARGVFRGRAGLGRGLGALIPERPATVAPSQGAKSNATKQPRPELVGASDAAGELGIAQRPGALTVDIDLIGPNPQQPRSSFDPESLATLTDSIRQHGLLQPLIVSRQQSPRGGVSYQLIAGERRLHAARAAGLKRVPAVVRDVTPLEQLELALVENIQRADLNPLEEALAFERLSSEFGLTQEALARRVGRSRVAVANTLRLLGLSNEIKASLASGEVTEGHGRSLLGVADVQQRRQLWREVVDRGLSVRETEALVRARRDSNSQGGAPDTERPKEARRQDPDTAALAERLQSALGTAVRIDHGRRGGRLVINFYSDEELDGLTQRLLADEESY